MGKISTSKGFSLEGAQMGIDSALSALSAPSQRTPKSGSFNELLLLRQRLSFLRLLPHMFPFTNPSVFTFPGAHVGGGLWESGSGRVCQAPLTISAKAILAALARAASPQPQQGRYREWIWEQPQGNRSPARPQHVPLPPALPEGFGAQIPRGAAEGAAGVKPGRRL